MAERTITWARNASIELRSILEFYAERNQSTTYSQWLLREMNYRASLIAHFPKIGRVTDRKDIRIFPFQHYGILYKFSESKIHILSVWDFRRNPDDRIDKR
ncbi:type II toxin-antitoxin system RelE/ParE family toxin [Dyadobacter aurulentus]|uniref:type II toxin-antitoxin system RelE/ParE family toxin n=1 Tax=Dyadobacter sp. UC 10 TaxID=2605428 RepID=UPI0011F1F74B|nr:type II toxin-antitoxin system RelE/ParE family toxin [Dyadobacter sp. UC 10]